MLMLAATAGASAHTEYSESGTAHWLEHVSASINQPTERQLAPYGYASPGATPGRAIVVGKETRYLNVEQLETVAIRVGDRAVIWTFDAFPRRNFPLSKIIPGAEGVTVYVAESPLYRGR
ncbi:CzcE family metal-binding protein [Aromatoleum toluclasticum]|uniref:CzcE family metal-binding protein n=1 Tax=Aromatoleum toluclasticum TaxID=92003 RepID=UPI001D187A8F|nr:CzcE family metal-binding protein [Aromatoleum toluclasticum]MCC4118140.1 CzcE family metal-binding protein [Aromatoleum toluclasticum]